VGVVPAEGRVEDRAARRVAAVRVEDPVVRRVVAAPAEDPVVVQAEDPLGVDRVVDRARRVEVRLHRRHPEVERRAGTAARR
jgi:hypothetical protein